MSDRNLREKQRKKSVWLKVKTILDAGKLKHGNKEKHNWRPRLFSVRRHRPLADIRLNYTDLHWFFLTYILPFCVKNKQYHDVLLPALYMVSVSQNTHTMSCGPTQVNTPHMMTY